ncbi:hypothetical protein QQZ08_005274 [Neonectria magnoliae]|uniref:inosine/xanthosine triphosphatase n=1 Tax=Neonectria magnoliae TaxID=2732573 RepID=A0ABR1I5L9_9HYPO
MTSSEIILVSSTNPVKIKATSNGFNRMLPSHYEFSGITVPSDVSEQPLSDEETLRGAMNRVQNARTSQPEADYWVGIEGGVDIHDGEISSFAWVVITSKEGRTGKARTSSLYLPTEVATLIHEGMEMGPANDKVFGQVNTKQHSGAVGLLTGDIYDRCAIYEQAVILALIPFKNTGLTFK